VNLRKVLTYCLLFIFISSTALALSFSISVDEITKSIQNEPEKWVITSYKAVFFGDSEKAKYAKNRAFPHSDDNAEMVLGFNLYNEYVNLEVPLKRRYKGNDLQKLIRTIKIHKYNKYKKELGIKDKVVIKEVEKPKQTRGIKKLY